MLALVLALALTGWATAPAWAAPAEEEYKLQIPSAAGGGSASLEEVRGSSTPGAGGESSSSPGGDVHSGLESTSATKAGERGLPRTGLEPSTLGLLGVALAALGFGLRRAVRSPS